MAPCGKEQGVFAGATARIENRADDFIGGGLERRLGLADVPGRAAGVELRKDSRSWVNTLFQKRFLLA